MNSKTTPSKTPSNPKEEESVKKEAPVQLEPAFANLGELLDAREGRRAGLSNKVSLEVAYEKGIYPYSEKMATAEL